MNKFVWAAAGLIALSAAPALAADLPAKVYTKAPMIAPVYNWGGFYIGANAGGGWVHDCRTNINTGLGLGCYDPSGAVAGGQIGYRWQIMNNWVFGLEAQGDWADIKGDRQNVVTAANRLGTKLDGALNLARLLRPESVRFAALFSSIAGRFGNLGQSDYAAANEALNKLALWLLTLIVAAPPPVAALILVAKVATPLLEIVMVPLVPAF